MIDKKRFSKKGMTMMFTALIVIVVISVMIIFLIVIFKKISDGAEEEAYRTRCKSSLMAYSRIKSLPFGDVNADEADINCPTRYYLIEDEGDNAMRRQIANHMVECWSNFGEGKINLFNAEDDKFCVICSVLQFEDTSTQLTGLTSFLMTEQAPIMVDRQHPTYYEYILGHQTDPSVIDEATSSVDLNYLDGSKRYAIMFTFFKESYWSQLQSAIWGAAAGVLTGVVIVVGVTVGLVVAGASFGIGTPVSALIITGSVAAGAAIGAGSAHETSGVTTEGAAWDANLIMTEYTPEGLTSMGCDALPVSQVDERFR